MILSFAPSSRPITPSQLALFSRSPRIGAWWEELKARGLFTGEQPPPSSLDEQLFADGSNVQQRMSVARHQVAW
jgi:uncharacterized protein